MRFLDDYDPRKEQKKKQQKNGAQKAPRSGNSLFPFAQNSQNKTNTPTATPRTTKGTALGGSSVTPVQLPQRQLTVPKLTKAAASTQKTTATRVPQQLKIPEIKAFGASMPTARKTAATTRRTVDTATIPEIRAFGASTPTARKTETTARRTVDTVKMPEIKALGAGDYSAGAKSLEGFFTRVGKTIAGGSKGALASNMDAMGAAYEAGQGQRTSMYEAELREAQWAVARAKRDYDLDPSQTTKTELDAALTKMKAFATVLGDGAYQQALTAAYDAAVKIGTVETTKELTALYNSLGKVNVDASTGVQQQATEAARDMALDVQVSGSKDIASAKEGLGQFGQMVVDAGASGTQMAIDILLNKAMGTPGSKLPFAFRAFGGATQQARADGADITGQVLYGGAAAAKEVATEMIFNIALPFTKAYGGGALDDVVQNGIQKAVNKLGKTDAGKRALNALLQIGASGMSEGLEEFIGDWMEWQMPRLYGGEVSSAEETLANSLYDYVVGGLSGMGGAVISPGTYRLHMPQLTTYEQRQAAEASGQRTATRYTAEEAAAKRKDARTFRNIIAGIDTSISDFFDRWKNGRKSHLGEKLEQLYIAPMPNNMAEDISKIVGYNVNGRDFIVTSDDVKHVMDQHGNPNAEIAKGNIPLETWMLDALSDVVTNPDSIEPGNLGTGNKNAGKRGIVFSKAFPGGKIITIQFDNKGRGTLELNTLYAKESAILEGNGTNAPNTFTPEAAKSALSYAEKPHMSRYTMPNTTESAVPVINVQSGPPQSFSSETSVPQGGTSVNTQGMQDGGEYATAPAAPLQMPQLTDAQGRTYEERVAWQQIPETQRAAFDEAQRIAQRFGARVVVSQQEGVNGSYRDGVISLNPNAANPVRRTLIHELTHHMESSGLYGKFRDMALRYVAETMNVDVDSVRQAVIADYAQNGVALDEDGATREIVAKFAEEKLFTDEATVRRLLAEDRNLFQRIYDWIRDTVGKLTGTSEENFLRSAEKLYAKALRETTAESGRGTQMQYDINPFHRDAVEQWNREGRPEGETFILGSTGPVLQGLGAMESDIYMQGDKINRILYDHPEMTLEEIKRLPEILEDPVLVLKSKGNGKAGKTSRVVMFGTVRAQNGQPVMAVLDLQPYENGFLVTDMQKVNSSYTKKNPADFISSSEVLYADEKRAAPLLRLTGLTIASQQLLQNGSVGSISYAGQDVNIEGTPFSDMTNRKAAQLSAIQQSNPANAALGPHTWVRSVNDILTYQEAIDNFGGVDDVTPDFRAQDVQAALDSGYVTVYSSYPIEQGTFVTPSRMEAQSYAGEGRVYSKQVPLDDVAWLDEVQGQYTGPVGQEQYSTGRGLDDLADDEEHRLQVPRLTTYEERQAEQRAERVADLVDNIDALREAVDNGLRSPQLTTYEERTRAKAEADTSVVRDRVRNMDAMTDAAAERAVEQRTQQEQQGREMPEALKKLGVEPFGSEADYAGIDNLAQEMRWNDSARKQTQRQMNKIPATEKERTFARRLADGTLDAADIPNTVNRETVETLADFYRTLDSAPETMLLRQRRAIIMEREEAKMEPLLGMDVAYDEGGLRTDIAGLRKPSGRITKTTSTLRRNLQTPARICATEWGPEHGKKVYETLFYPVTENNGRQIDWVNSMLDRVRTFKDSKGEERPLNRKERELVQKIVEYRASEKRVAAFDEQYKDAVENVRNGASATDAAKEFGIDPSYQEYQDLQNYQTYLRTLEELHDSKSADSTAVDNAVEAYSGLYRELYDGINSFLVAHGYQPIGFIEGYAPHIQPEAEKTAFSKALKLLGLDDTAMSLPTSISGKTADLKPYKQYNPFFQERHGVNTEYDIAKGFEDYVYYLGNIFYHTDDIMRIRTAEKYIRKTYSSEEASELIDQAESARDFSNDQIMDFLRVSGVVQKGTELAPGDARVFLEDYIGKLYDQIGNVTRYSEMAKYLDNYANRLAGKQNMADRGAEAATGRSSLNWINTLTGKYGGAKLAFNFSSALNQTSQIPMVAAENGEVATLHAIGDFFKSKKDRASFVQKSNFLKGKKGIDWLLGAETPWEKVKEFSFSPIEAVDSFTSYVAVRSKYLKEIRAGKSHEDAMKLADEYGRNVMGSRARGEKPMLFDTKNPFWQIVTRFQLEALNTWEHISRDLPNEVRQLAREKGKAYAAGTMGVRVAKYLIYGFLLNLGVGALSGGSPVPYDVVGSVMEALGKSMGVSKLALVGKLADNVLEAIFDKRLFGTDGDDDEDDAEKDWWTFLESLWGDIANDVPIVGQLAALTGVGDETLPVADLSKVGDFVESVKKKGVFNGDTLDKGLTAASEFVYGGNQLRKTIQGGKAVVQGGVYSKGKLRYQVDQTPMNYVKGFLFGRSALDESQAYYAERTSDFTEKQTDTFQQMQDVGVSAKASYDLIRELKEAEETEQFTEAEWQREILRQSQVNDSGKWVAYYQTMASDKEVEAMDAVEYYSEADYGTVTYLLMDMKDMETDAEKMRLIDSSDLTEQQKASLYKSMVAGDEDLEKISALQDADITDYQYFQYKLTTSGLTKKEAKLNAINTLDLTDSQKDAMYYLNSYASSTHGEAPWVQGMTAEQSTVRLAEILAEDEDDEGGLSKWQQSLYTYLGTAGIGNGYERALAVLQSKHDTPSDGYEQALEVLQKRMRVSQIQTVSDEESSGYYRALAVLQQRRAGTYSQEAESDGYYRALAALRARQMRQ